MKKIIYYVLIILFVPSCSSNNPKVEILREGNNEVEVLDLKSDKMKYATFSTDKTSFNSNIISRSGEFKTTVKTNGKEMTNFSSPLIERITITPSNLSEIKLEQLYDLNNHLSGLKITEANDISKLNFYSLKVGDIIIAIGHGQLVKEMTFSDLNQEITSQGKSMLTIERNGEPRKIYYFID